MKVRVVVEQDEDGRFVATCSALPGCISEGDTREEALANIQDAIAGYVESLRKHGEPVPPPPASPLPAPPANSCSKRTKTRTPEDVPPRIGRGITSHRNCEGLLTTLWIANPLVL